MNYSNSSVRFRQRLENPISNVYTGIEKHWNELPRQSLILRNLSEHTEECARNDTGQKLAQ